MIPSLIILILSIVVLTNFVLTFIIFMRGVRQIAHIIFAFISLCSGLWGLAIIGFYAPQSFFPVAINWIIPTHILAILIALLFLYFSFSFPKQILRHWSAYLIPAIPTLYILYEIVWGGTIIGNITGMSYELRSGYVMYGAIVSIYFLLGYYFLLRQYHLAKTNDTKYQIKYLLTGSILSSTLAIIPDLIMPYLNIFSFTWLGPVFTLILVGSIFIAIIRYRLFNVKVIIAEITIAIIIIFLTAQIFFSSSTAELIVKTILLLFVIGLSYLLIKSVYNEIGQRENIEKLAKQLEAANTRLKEIDKQKSEFVSFASHQLRGPLTAIKGYASLILEGDLGKVNDEVTDAVSKIFASSKTLASVVDDYLNISRIELGTMKYNFVPIQLNQLVESTIGELKPNFEKEGVAYSFVCDTTKSYTVSADPDKLKQVIANLIDNSIKYSPKGTVRIEVTADTEKKTVRFTVSDNGIGMSPVTLGKIFNKFTRADQANRVNIRGTGLGLYVAKDIVGSHKGKIWAESDGEDKGSRFIFELGSA